MGFWEGSTSQLKVASPPSFLKVILLPVGSQVTSMVSPVVNWKVSYLLLNSILYPFQEQPFELMRQFPWFALVQLKSKLTPLMVSRCATPTPIHDANFQIFTFHRFTLRLTTITSKCTSQVRLEQHHSLVAVNRHACFRWGADRHAGAFQFFGETQSEELGCRMCDEEGQDIAVLEVTSQVVFFDLLPDCLQTVQLSLQESHISIVLRFLLFLGVKLSILANPLIQFFDQVVSAISQDVLQLDDHAIEVVNGCECFLPEIEKGLICKIRCVHLGTKQEEPLLDAQQFFVYHRCLLHQFLAVGGLVQKLPEEDLKRQERSVISVFLNLAEVADESSLFAGGLQAEHVEWFFNMVRALESEIHPDDMMIINGAISDIIRDYQLQAKNEESGLTYLLHRETRELCLLREMAHHDLDQFQKSMKELRMRMEFRGEGVLRLLRLQSEELESICSKIFKVHTLWEYGNCLLSDEINSRGLERRSFEHTRIIALLKDICKGLNYYHRNGITYDCLTTKTIISTSSSFKLIDPLMLTLQRNLQTVFNNRNIKNIYLSPEQCKMIELEYNQRSTEKDVVFTAGMMVLEAATLERKNNCYLDRCSLVDWKCVQTNINIVGSRYGADLAEILREMLRPQAKDRIGFSDLLRKINGLSQQAYIKTQGNESTNSNRPVTARQSYSTIAHCSIASNLIPSQTVMHSTIHIHQSNHNSLPQRMVQTTHRPVSTPTQSKISPISLKPPALQEMKTINITTEIIKEQPVNFTNQLSTAKTNQFLRGNFDSLAYSPQQFSPFNPKQINASTGFSVQPRQDSRIIMHKYQHSGKKHPLQQYCVEQFNKGSRYEGYKINGKRDGWGKFNFQDGGLYEGEWRENKMHGFGSLYYQSGKLAYEGQWVMDEFQGIGKLYNQSYKKLNTPFNFHRLTDIEDYWVTYEGTFKNDAKVGRGIMKLSNGQSFEGHFQNDEIHGQGTFQTMQGNRIRGLWNHGILQTIYQSF